MNSVTHHALAKTALVKTTLAGVVLAAALALAGCGRKGPLDPPPSAAITQPGQPGGQPAQPDQFDEQGHPVAPAARGKRPFILDWLLD